MALLSLTPLSALSQTPVEYASRRELSLGLDVARSSAWDVELSPPNASTSTISDAIGLAFTISYNITPSVAPWITYAASLYGDSDVSGFSELAGGLEFRGLWFGRFVPSIGIGFGRTTAPTAGGFSFNHSEVAANAEFFVARRVALRAGLRRHFPVADPMGSSRSGDTEFDVSDGRTQLRFGIRVRLGSGD
jgi:hypothetical protein